MHSHTFKANIIIQYFRPFYVSKPEKFGVRKIDSKINRLMFLFKKIKHCFFSVNGLLIKCVYLTQINNNNMTKAPNLNSTQNVYCIKHTYMFKANITL